MALYRREPNEQHAKIDCRGSDLPMNDVEEVRTQLGLLSFLKAAGEQGWEMCSSLAPWPEGQRFSVENEDGTEQEDEIVENRFDIQWLIFKRPTN
ncbi:MAG: hypothetical protein WDM87_04460 [Terracidiphilus sp.]